MKQEDKELLLRDLCSRLPYGVIIEHGGNLSRLDTIFMCDSISISSTSLDGEDLYNLSLDEFKPYLFPLSSMTEEQKKEYHELIGGMFGTSVLINFEVLEELFHKNHFDYRGLIEKGLAIDCTNLNIY